MTRNLKTLGLALIAVIATVAMTASSASAEIFVFKSEAASTTLKGEQEGSGKIKVEAGTVTCEKTKFSGEMPDEYEFEVTMTPTYESRSMGEGTTEDVTTGCDYLFVANEKESTNYEAEARIKCEAGKAITITKKVLGVTKCTITIGAQEGLKTVTSAETGSPTALRTTIAFSSLKYSQTAGTGLGACATLENKTNGTYEGTVVVKDFQGESQKNMQDEALPKSIEISKNPIKLAGKNSTTTHSKAAELRMAVAGAGVRPRPRRGSLSWTSCSISSQTASRRRSRTSARAAS